MVRPGEMAQKAQKAQKGSGKKSGGGQGGAASIKVGRDSGRVKVFVRVRPMRSQEHSRKQQTSVEVSELNSQIHVSDPKHSWEKDYPFDHVFPSGANNNEVCNTLCKPIVSSALNGFNGTLMAYGQTGSGKTYTLMAPDGITVGVVDRCFKRIMQDDKHDYRVSMSYLQIYQEKIYDLLNSTNKVDLNIREHPQKGVYVENLSEFVVRAPSEIISLMAVGRKRLIFAETKMNRTSSRSHSVLTLIIERTLNKGEVSKDCVPKAVERRSSLPRKDSKDMPKLPGSPKKALAAMASAANNTEDEDADGEDSLTKMAFTDDVLIRGRIHLCDLAGSERLKKTQAEGDRLSEAQHINSSLLELGNVIHALAENEEKKTHIPFRNSTLTRLLQESLGGNCKTSLIVCVSPCMSDVSETKSTLNFGSRAMKITNTAYVNLEVDYKRLSDDLSKLLDSRENEMSNLKESYENRIEKVKVEADTRLSTAMTEAQVALSSARGLFESQESALREELSKINKELEYDKKLSNDLQDQLSTLGRCLYGGVHRAKSALLAEILSMQLFYAIRDLPDEDRRDVAEQMALEYPYYGAKLAETKIKVLDNTDNMLTLFKGYLQLFNKSGQSLNDSGVDLKTIEQSLVNGNSILLDNFVNGSRHSDVIVECLEENESRFLEWNKTDDDKVVESSTIDTDFDHQKLGKDRSADTGSFLCKTKSLRDALLKIRSSLDGDAIEFLEKAFGVDMGGGRTRGDVYGAMKEMLQNKEQDEGMHSSDKVLPLLAEMALLDQSLCHVLVDKALQSSVLLLEHTESRQKCDELSTNNVTMNKELEVLRIQVQTLNTENAKLSTKLSETSTFLKDVKTSKSRLEDDLSSVFQLYNMRPTDPPLHGGASSPEPEGVSGISSLVEENAKLKVELKDCKIEREELQTQLDITKDELYQTEMLLESLRDSPTVSATSSRRSSIRSTAEIRTEVASSFKYLEDDLGKFLFHVQEELGNIEKTETALEKHSHQKKAISDLRTAMNKRLTDQWKLKILENASLRNQVAELTKVFDIDREKYGKQIDRLKKELQIELKTRSNVENKLYDKLAELTETLEKERREYAKRINDLKDKMRVQSQAKMEVENELRNQVDKLTRELDTEREINETQIDQLKTELHIESQARIDVENELLQKSKQLARLDDELWGQYDKRPDSGVSSDNSSVMMKESPSGSERVEIVQRVIHRNSISTKEHTRKLILKGDDVDGLGSVSQMYNPTRADSLNDTELDDSIRVTKEELLQAQRENDSTKEELGSLKKRFTELGEELADSSKIQEELEQRFAELQDEKGFLELKLEESEERFEALQNEFEKLYLEHQDLEVGLNEAIEDNDELVAKVSSLKGSNEELEGELGRLQSLLSSSEVEVMLIDSRYKEKVKKLDDTAYALRQSQDNLNQSKEEFKDLHHAFEMLRTDFEESDRESLVEVTLASPTYDSPGPRPRLQSIHLLSRAKGQGRKGGQSPGKKKLAYKINSPRQADKLSPELRSNSLKRRSLNRQDPKRGSIGRQGITKSSPPRGHDAKRNSLRRVKAMERGSSNGRSDSEEDGKLKNELLLAKEQLVRLKAELTASNVQTTDIGSQLTCLREDSNKLEAELTTMKRAPSVNEISSDTARNLEIDRHDSREKIVVLQNQVVYLRQEKTAAEDKAEDKLKRSEEQMTKLRTQMYKVTDSLDRNQELVKILSKENTDLKDEVERLRERLSHYANDTIQDIVSSKEKDHPSLRKHYIMKDRKRLEKEIQDLSEHKIRFEDMQNLVHQLVSAEDEKTQLKHKLRLALQSSIGSSGSDELASDKESVATKQKGAARQIKYSVDDSDQKFEEMCVENTSLRCEVDALRIYIGNLENEIKSWKFKLSVSESTHGNTSKKVLGTLLASAKHEREELRETLNEVYSEKEDLEEELGVSKIKCVKLQRELVKVIGEKETLESEVQTLNSSQRTESRREDNLMSLLKSFLASIGVDNANEKDIKELVVSLIARSSYQVTDRGKLKPITRQKSRSLDYRQGSIKRHALKRSAVAKPIRTGDSSNRSKPVPNKPTSNPVNMRQAMDRSSQSALNRDSPNYEREMPEGMEHDENDAAAKAVTKDSGKQANGGSTKIADVLDGEIHIKRSWSIKDIFKRSSGKSVAAPLYVNQ